MARRIVATFARKYPAIGYIILSALGTLLQQLQPNSWACVDDTAVDILALWSLLLLTVTLGQARARAETTALNTALPYTAAINRGIRIYECH